MSEERDDPIFDGEGPSPGPEYELDEAAERALGEALRAAWDPAPLDPARHREILELALTDPFAPATEDEVRESERLRVALESGDARHEDVALLHALSAATKADAPSAEASERAKKRLSPEARAPRSNVVFVSFGATALAVAAAFALFVGRTSSEPSARVERLLPSRSTADLFEGQFEQGKTTDRIDRIASARAHDLRENRYAQWGAR